MICLDHNATAPMLAALLEAMMPYAAVERGNRSGAYKCGSNLKTVIEPSRE